MNEIADAANTLQPVPTTPVATDINLSLTPMEMLSRAVMQGASIEVLERLMDLNERLERKVARRAYDAAIALAKSEIKPIPRNRTGAHGKKYADLAAIAEAIDHILSKYGLSYRFRAQPQNNLLLITCIVSHKDGHSEENSLPGAPDTGSGRSSVQAIGSTVTYLQRYTLMQALGLAAAEDDDGDQPKRRPVAAPDAMRPKDANTLPRIVAERTPPAARVAPAPPEEAPKTGGKVPGEIKEVGPVGPKNRTIKQIQALENEAKAAADRGSDVFSAFWKGMDRPGRVIIQGMATILRERMEIADQKLRDESEAVSDPTDYDPETGEVS